jgi:anthranilate phosphoribosyltransferase
MTLADLTPRLLAGARLDEASMGAAIDDMMSGRVAESEIAAFLTALAAKGETAEEVAGAAAALRRHMTPVRHRFDKLLDTCGTGGGGSQIFNVSTTAAIVIAACGVPVAKHGNRSVTSRSGSADVLAELGVNIAATLPQVERCLDELGLCFCFAPLMHPAMKNVSAVRKSLGIRTIFNILGPLANPARATHQLLGAGRPEIRPLLAAALERLDVERALVVSGEDGLGEVTVAGPTRISEVSAGQVREFTATPADYGLPESSLDAALVEDAAQSAAIARGVLAGQRGAPRDLVIANAATGLAAFDESLSLADAALRAAEAIDSDAARKLLERLVLLSHVE